jgi:hypothetical protein
MVLRIHQPEVAMSEHIIRIGNIDRPTSWITFYFESEDDASQAAALLKEALQNCH